MNIKKNQIAISFLILTLVLNISILFTRVEPNSESYQIQTVPKSFSYAYLGVWIIIAGDRNDHDKFNSFQTLIIHLQHFSSGS